MSGYALVALILLSAPSGGSVSGLRPDPVLRAALQQQALALEILDPRELGDLLAYPWDFESDLNVLRERYAELCDAPPDRDAQRFPPRQLCNELLAFNQAYQHHLQQRLLLEPARADELRIALQEAGQLFRIWDLIRDARCEFYFIHSRRQALKQLRQLLGEEAYYSGQAPPHIPFWRFQEIR